MPYMKQLYEKSEIRFAVICILLYVAGSSIADRLSKGLGCPKLITLAFDLCLCLYLIRFLRSNQLSGYYGLCKSQYPPVRFLFYIPLVVLASVNLWFGVQRNMPVFDTVCYVGSMLLVGFLEELIFRGLLFQAMRKSNEKSAMVLSSLLFGVGHIVNLFNGSGTELAANLCQVVYACAVGFLFVTIFRKGGSLWPCVITHGVLNALSAFGREEAAARHRVMVSAVLCVIAVVYTWYLWRKLPDPGKAASDS